MSLRPMSLVVGVILVGGAVLSHVVEGSAHSSATVSAAVTGSKFLPYNRPESLGPPNGDAYRPLRLAGAVSSKSSPEAREKFFKDCMDIQLVGWLNKCKRLKDTWSKFNPPWDLGDCIKNERDKALSDPRFCRPS
jgi:hypothetical protein